jgi:serine/threonine protein kinase
LADFGLAVNINSDKSRIGGSMLYLSPSRFIKGSEVTSADDMFAFGIVVCEFSNRLTHPYYNRSILKGLVRQ